MKQKTYLHIWAAEKDNEPPEFLFRREIAEETYLIYLGEVEVSFEVPSMPSDDELTTRKVAYLRKGREEVMKEFNAKLANIDRSISELLALPSLET